MPITNYRLPVRGLKGLGVGSLHLSLMKYSDIRKLIEINSRVFELGKDSITHAIPAESVFS